MTADEFKALAVRARDRETRGWFLFDILADALDEAGKLVDEYERAINQPHHVMQITEDGWTLEHVMACRTDPGGLAACPLNQAADRQANDFYADFGVGRYVVVLQDDTLENRGML